MISLIHYISSVKRLDECNKTVLMLGGSLYHDDNIPMQIAAQREMIKREVEYYEEQVKLLGIFTFVFVLVAIFVIITMIQFGVFK
jgi:hypothetical protein